jgi:hypothetical protein
MPRPHLRRRLPRAGQSCWRAQDPLQREKHGVSPPPSCPGTRPATRQTPYATCNERAAAAQPAARAASRAVSHQGHTPVSGR